MYVVEGGLASVNKKNPSTLRDRLAWISDARVAAASAREMERARFHPEFVLTLPHQLQKNTG